LDWLFYQCGVEAGERSGGDAAALVGQASGGPAGLGLDRLSVQIMSATCGKEQKKGAEPLTAFLVVTKCAWALGGLGACENIANKVE